MGRLPAKVLSTVSRNYAPLMLFDILIASFYMEVLCTLGAAGEKRVSLELSCRAGVASHSQLSFTLKGDVAAR